MRKAKAIYDAKTGRIVKHFVGPESQLASNIPEGCLAIDGVFDPHSQRIDVATGKAIDYQPLQPSSDHEWSQARKRWMNTREARDAKTQARIKQLEERQARRVRELLAASDPRLQALDEEISALRATLNGNAGLTDG